MQNINQKLENINKPSVLIGICININVLKSFIESKLEIEKLKFEVILMKLIEIAKSYLEEIKYLHEKDIKMYQNYNFLLKE